MSDRARIEKAQRVLGLTRKGEKPEERVYATRPFKKALSHIAKARNILEPVARERQKIWMADTTLARDIVRDLGIRGEHLRAAIRNAER